MRKILIIILLICFKIVVFAPDRWIDIKEAESWYFDLNKQIKKEVFINSFRNRIIGDIVYKTCRKYNLNQYFVKQIIEIESQGYSRAVSKAGAVGLMQIMPSTAKLLNRTLKLKKRFLREDLFNVYINVELGCFYLDYLRKKYKSNWIKVIIEYNGGYRNIKKERIPKETYLYIIRLYEGLKQFDFDLYFVDY